MTTTQILLAARAKIEKGWCRGELAIDKAGHPVDPNSDAAVKWCVLGATGGDTDKMNAADNMLAAALGDDGSAVVAWNDDEDRTQADALALYDKAIALAAEAEARAIQLVEKGEA